MDLSDKIDPKRCAVQVMCRTGFGVEQCQNERGYGPGGRYCERHAPYVWSRNEDHKNGDMGDSEVTE